MLKFLRIPFATSGDKAAIGFPVDAGGAVSYSEGYPFDYQRAPSDPAVKNIERDKMNGLFFDITTAVKELQSQGIPDFITSALNGGTAYSYNANAVVTYSGDLYLSLAGSNTALPSDTTKWAPLPTPARIQTEAYTSDATVGGTANALTAELAPTVITLAGQAFRIRAAFANTTTNPTLNLDGTGALTIVKGNNLPLVAGDIPGAGAWLDIKHDVTLGRYVLLNPATGTNAIGFGQTWQNVTASRSAGVTYYNTTGKPIMLSIYGSAATTATFNMQIDGVTLNLLAYGNPGTSAATFQIIVPAGSSYMVFAGSGTIGINSWLELR
jgi:hypothetical protein